MSYSDVLGNNITITAVASSGYMFSYWRMTSGDASVSDYNSYETTVAFGELNSYIEAVFTPRNTLGINTYTSVLTSELNLMSGERENAFVISYGDSHSIQREVYVGADQVNISAKIDSNHVNLNLKVNVDEYYDISNTYRYRFSHFQYADGRGTPSGVWTTVTPDSHGDCIINVPIAASSITLTAVYVKEEMCTLHLGLRSNNGYYSNIYNDITITATGDYGDYSNPLNPRFPKNTSVTVSEELNDGVDSSRYTFINWKKIIDDTETTDSNVTLSFTIMGSISVIANYTEKCKLTYSLINDSGIGSPEITCTDKTASSTVSTDTWIISGHEVSFTVSDLESGTYVNKWVCNDSSIDPDPEDPNYTNSLTFKIWQDSDVFAVIGTTPKTLTITISGNGSVSVDEIISTNYISIEPNVGTNTYSIGQGHGVRLTATPSTLSKFNQYIITSNGSTEQPTSAEYTIGDVQYDIDATAIFSKIPWIQLCFSVTYAVFNVFWLRRNRYLLRSKQQNRSPYALLREQ